MNTVQQIAFSRARYHAKTRPEHARKLLMSAGIPWRQAGIYVLTERRKQK